MARFVYVFPLAIFLLSGCTAPITWVLREMLLQQQRVVTVGNLSRAAFIYVVDNSSDSQDSRESKDRLSKCSQWQIISGRNYIKQQLSRSCTQIKRWFLSNDGYMKQYVPIHAGFYISTQCKKQIKLLVECNPSFKTKTPKQGRKVLT